MSFSLSHQPLLPFRPSPSSPSHATNASHAALVGARTPSPKLKGKDRSLSNADSNPLDFGYGYGHSECLLLCLSLERTHGIAAEAIAAASSRSCSIVSRAGEPTRTTTEQMSSILDPSLPAAHSTLSPSLFGKDADNLGSKSSDSSPSVTTHDSSHSVSLHSHFQQHSTSLPSRHRTSFLSAASDALGLRKKPGSVSRKKPNFHSIPHTSNIMPGVIEINARNNTTVTATVGGATAHKDYEHEERERLRDVAAQSIGLDPVLLHHSCKSESRSSLDSPQSSSQPARIPPFPATMAVLRPFTELSATLPKFTPPSSLLVFALARQWKLRTIVLTSHPVSQKTYVHLFKGTSKDEKEIERLEVNEDSAIFVTEENIGGRNHVVKFAATRRSGAIGEESLCTRWFLQIKDPAESQRWIGAIKNAVLTQRYNLLSFAIARSSNR